MKKNSSQTVFQGSFKGDQTCEKLLSTLDSIYMNSHNPYTGFPLDFSPFLGKSFKSSNLDLSSTVPKGSFYCGVFENFQKDKWNKPNRQLILHSRARQGYHQSSKNLNSELALSSVGNGEFATCPNSPENYSNKAIRPKTATKMNGARPAKFYRDFGKSFTRTNSIVDGKLEIEGKKGKIDKIRIKRIIGTSSKNDKKKPLDSKLNKSITCNLDNPNGLKVEMPIIRVTSKKNIKDKNIQKAISIGNLEPW
ncbi:unnamed protein product [Blepharisma stoltei]|uniref:Uncharacterized protein n=1 Tax=Blepharisma stoltei TaxID=1481888 RepID=A0AAU9JID6_9CILI|nr:unnamed protein product [Blepharisma stoltei]